MCASNDTRPEHGCDTPDTVFSQHEFEAYFHKCNMEVSAEREKLYEVDIIHVNLDFLISSQRFGTGNFVRKLGTDSNFAVKAKGSSSTL